MINDPKVHVLKTNSSLFRGILVGIFLFFAPFFISGIFCLGLAARSAYLTSIAMSWPTTAAIVVASSIDTTQSTVSSSTKYSPRISYTYYLNGQKYTSDRIDFGGKTSSNFSYAKNIVSRYPLNGDIEIRYNPRKPTEAVLEAAVGWGFFISLGLGLVFLLVGASPILLFVKLREMVRTNK